VTTVAEGTTEAEGEIGGVGDDTELGRAPPHVASSSVRTIGEI
jgi:hypothetical protein